MQLPGEMYLTLIDHGGAVGVGIGDYTTTPAAAADQAGAAYEDGNEFTVLMLDGVTKLATDVTGEITKIIEARLEARRKAGLLEAAEDEAEFEDAPWGDDVDGRAA